MDTRSAQHHTPNRIRPTHDAERIVALMERVALRPVIASGHCLRKGDFAETRVRDGNRRTGNRIAKSIPEPDGKLRNKSTGLVERIDICPDIECSCAGSGVISLDRGVSEAVPARREKEGGSYSDKCKRFDFQGSSSRSMREERESVSAYMLLLNSGDEI